MTARQLALAPEAAEDVLARLRAAALTAQTEEEARAVTAQIREWIAEARRALNLIPRSPLEQAQDLDRLFVPRAHLAYLSERLTEAVHEVEQGRSHYIAVSMPPRAGKTTLISRYLALWVLRQHTDWPLMLTSHSPTLATSWGRTLRRLAVKHEDLGIHIAPDAGAAGEWETTEGGTVVSRSIGGGITGHGAKVLVVDDPHKGLAEAHSEVLRDRVWDWWLGEAFPRLDRGGHLVVVVQTRWHEDDMIGRLTSIEHEGNPDEWEVIRFPAIAEEADVLGRNPGDPLLSPQVPDETREQALTTWQKIKDAVGTYVWEALYQGRPAPAKGAIFDVSWFRYWTRHPENVTDDGTVVHLDVTDPPTGQWVDSWDMAFKATDSSDYVVGQRWLIAGANRYLIQQTRERLSFTGTLARMLEWANPTGTAARVGERLVEDKANGTAVIDTLRDRIPGLIPINPTESKTARARAVTPEVEAGNVLLPYPGDPGNEWVADLLAELRSFPTGAHDDQVDALTQVLRRVRRGVATIMNPARSSMRVPGVPTQWTAGGRPGPGTTGRR